MQWVEFPLGRRCSRRSTPARSTTATPATRRRSSPRPRTPNINYVAVIPARGYGQAIVVPADSPAKSLSDLKGKKIGVAKGSSAHNLLVSALESGNIAWSDIKPVYLAPADAASAFSRGAIDAWSIWDPFYAIAELKQKARALPIDPKATIQNSFFLANRDFLAKHPDIVGAINEEVAKATNMGERTSRRGGGAFRRGERRRHRGAKALRRPGRIQLRADDDKVIAEQQAVADRFQRLGLIPRRSTCATSSGSGKPSA